MKQNFFKRSLPILAVLALASCSSDDNSLLRPAGPQDPTINDDTVIIEDSKPSLATPSKGFYVINEDWFGHDLGTVNYFKNDGSILYRAYRATNPGETLGLTSQFATIYGENTFLISKQQNRLVVADAKTLKKKALLTDIGGDGRSFVGVTSKKGYIATSSGVSIFNIETMSLEGNIAGISGETGNMILAGDYVFTITKSKGTYVINTKTDSVEKLIDGTDFAMIVQSKDGNVWIGANQKLIQINPYSLEKVSEVDISEAPITATWYAWTAGSLSASTQQNTLYWAKGNDVVKFDIDSQSLNTAFYKLGKDNQDMQLGFYGASLKVDPLTDKLILLVKRDGWGDSGSYNWVQVVNNNGVLDKNIIVKGDNGLGGEWGTDDDRYFWFPAMPFFEDANTPEILLNQVILTPDQRIAIALNDKIVDADNTSVSIIKSLKSNDSKIATYEIKQDSLIVSAKGIAGKDKLTIIANSNGKSVEKEIRIDVRN